MDFNTQLINYENIKLGKTPRDIDMDAAATNISEYIKANPKYGKQKSLSAIQLQLISLELIKQ